ncbi:MAG TPA: DinB family protein [Phnomibacter sp.]|nr:DinB family protein [Phnomibacter sp.]
MKNTAYQAELNSFLSAANEFTDLIEGLPESTLNQIPVEGSWSAAQVGDHILKSFMGWGVLTGKTEEPKRAPDALCQEISTIFADRTIKMEAPPALQASTGFIAQAPLVARLRAIVAKMVTFFRIADLSLLCVDRPVGKLGYLTRLEWLYLYTVHTERHSHQVKQMVAIISSQ